MPIVTGGNAVAPDYHVFPITTAPVAGTNAVQTITIGGTPTGGTFAFTLDGNRTAPITWSSTNATLIANIDTALEALPNIGTSGVTVAAGTLTAGVGTITVTFNGQFTARRIISTMSVASSLTGTSPTISVATTTNGVEASYVSAPTGGQLLDTTNGRLFINTGPDANPTWTVVGSQT